jgi:hypothetical protein
LINGPTPAGDFKGTAMKIYRLDSTSIGEKMSQSLTSTDMEVSASFGSFFATGFAYNIHWKFGASDPLSMGIVASEYFNTTDEAVILRFNYSANRETFDIYRNTDGDNTANYTNVSTIPDTTVCNEGNWFNDRTNKLFYFCASGKNKTKYEYTEVEGVICRNDCSSLGDVA